MNNNLILIGMPGAGKSTVGVVIAKKLGYHFMDSDLVIQDRMGKMLHEIITERGTDGFLEVEGEINSSISCNRTVIATGGSAVYSSKAMEHFKQIGKVVYLQLSYDSIADRLGDLKERGVALQEGQTLRDLYEERIPLYEKYADITLNCDGKMIREVVGELAKRLA